MIWLIVLEIKDYKLFSAVLKMYGDFVATVEIYSYASWSDMDG